MLKEYQSQQSHFPLNNIVVPKKAGSVAKYGSLGASLNTASIDEQQRVDQIMREPIENLISNMDALSRPVSSKHQIPLNSMVKYKQKGRGMNNQMVMPQARPVRKSRALTAHNKQGLFATGISAVHNYTHGRYDSKGGALKITQSAYHLGKK